MHLTESLLKKLSIAQQRGLKTKMRHDGTLWHIEDTHTAQLVTDLMWDCGQGWCKEHEDWHAFNVHSSKYHVPYENCPTPARVPPEIVPPIPPSEGQGGEQTSAEIAGRLEEYFGGAEFEKQSAQAKVKASGELPKDMKQPGKDESFQKDKSQQCGVTHEKFTCTLQKDHEGDHIAHWSDGRNAKRWMHDKGEKPQTDAREPVYDKQCRHKMPEAYVCTKTKGHSGDHVAHISNGTEVSRQKQGEQKKKQWKKLLFNRCPDCQIDTLNARWQDGPEPEEKITYTEKPCGCKHLAEMQF